MDMRVATVDDLDSLVATVTSAFLADPLWAPVLGSAERASALWRLFIGSSLRYANTFVTPGVESVANWVPPGGELLTPAEEDDFEDFLVGIGDRQFAHRVMAMSDVFDSAIPEEPHFYLSLFGTHSDHRGSGLGMNLLKATLADIDERGAPAYLESSNPANDGRYRSVGFTDSTILRFASGARVTTFWRAAR